MSDQTITSVSLVDAASCRVTVEGDLSFSDAASRRVYGEAGRRVCGADAMSVPAQRLDSAILLS